MHLVHHFDVFVHSDVIKGENKKNYIMRLKSKIKKKYII